MFSALTFDNFWETLFWVHFGLILAQEPYNTIFPKKIVYVHFMVIYPVTLE